MSTRGELPADFSSQRQLTIQSFQASKICDVAPTVSSQDSAPANTRTYQNGVAKRVSLGEEVEVVGMEEDVVSGDTLCADTIAVEPGVDAMEVDCGDRGSQEDAAGNGSASNSQGRVESRLENVQSAELLEDLRQQFCFTRTNLVDISANVAVQAQLAKFQENLLAMDSPLTTIPDEILPLLSCLLQDRCEPEDQLVEHVVQTLCPSQAHLEKMQIPLVEIRAQVRVLGTHTDYGVPSPPAGLEDLKWQVWEATLLKHIPKPLQAKIRENRKCRRQFKKSVAMKGYKEYQKCRKAEAKARTVGGGKRVKSEEEKADAARVKEERRAAKIAAEAEKRKEKERKEAERKRIREEKEEQKRQAKEEREAQRKRVQEEKERQAEEEERKKKELEEKKAARVLTLDSFVKRSPAAGPRAVDGAGQGSCSSSSAEMKTAADGCSSLDVPSGGSSVASPSGGVQTKGSFSLEKSRIGWNERVKDLFGAPSDSQEDSHMDVDVWEPLPPKLTLDARVSAEEVQADFCRSVRRYKLISEKLRARKREQDAEDAEEFRQAHPDLNPLLRPRLKYLHFGENVRPPYYGTFSRAVRVSPRNPFGKDIKCFDYDLDSDEDWEEEDDPDCESITSDAGADAGAEPEDDADEEDDGFVVPTGYLSDDEGVGDLDDCRKCAVLEEISDVTEEQRRSMASSRNQLFADEDRGASDAATPATGQRARKKKKRMDPLMPRALGPCFWNDGPSREGAAAEVRDFLLRFSARVLAPEGQGLKLDWTEVEQDIAQVQEEIRNPPAPVPAPATGEATGVTTTTSTTCSSSPASCPPPNSMTAAPDLSVPKKRGRKSAASSLLSPASAVDSSLETPSSSSPSSTRSVDAVQLPALIQMVHGAKKSVSVLSSDFVASLPEKDRPSKSLVSKWIKAISHKVGHEFVVNPEMFALAGMARPVSAPSSSPSKTPNRKKKTTPKGKTTTPAGGKRAPRTPLKVSAVERKRKSESAQDEDSVIVAADLCAEPVNKKPKKAATSTASQQEGMREDELEEGVLPSARSQETKQRDIRSMMFSRSSAPVLSKSRSPTHEGQDTVDPEDAEHSNQSGPRVLTTCDAVVAARPLMLNTTPNVVIDLSSPSCDTMEVDSPSRGTNFVSVGEGDNGQGVSPILQDFPQAPFQQLTSRNSVEESVSIRPFDSLEECGISLVRLATESRTSSEDRAPTTEPEVQSLLEQLCAPLLAENSDGSSLPGSLVAPFCRTLFRMVLSPCLNLALRRRACVRLGDFFKKTSSSAACFSGINALLEQQGFHDGVLQIMSQSDGSVDNKSDLPRALLRLITLVLSARSELLAATECNRREFCLFLLRRAEPIFFAPLRSSTLRRQFASQVLYQCLSSLASCSEEEVTKLLSSDLCDSLAQALVEGLSVDRDHHEGALKAGIHCLNTLVTVCQAHSLPISHRSGICRVASSFAEYVSPHKEGVTQCLQESCRSILSLLGDVEAAQGMDVDVE